MNGLQLFQILDGVPQDDAESARGGRQVLDLRCRCGASSLGAVYVVEGSLKLVTARRRLTRAHTEVVLSDAVLMDFEEVHQAYSAGTSTETDAADIVVLSAFIERLNAGAVSTGLPALEVPPRVVILDGLDAKWASIVSRARKDGSKPNTFAYMDVTCTKCRRTSYLGRALAEDWLPITPANRPTVLVCHDKTDLSRHAGFTWPRDTREGRIRFYRHLSAIQ